MKVSYNWLESYIKTDFSPKGIAEVLTDTGLEVEGIEKHEAIPGGLEGLVIGEVLTREKHPDADRLSITMVDVGGDVPLNIVCGAPNVAAGQKVVVATVGATLYPVGGEPFQIKKSKIRGAASEGMICAEDEIGLGKSHEGIMVLSPDAKVGTPAADYFNIENDFVFEIGLTPNRADAASHIGVARDLAAALSIREKKHYLIQYPSVDGFSIKGKTSSIVVEIQDVKSCPRYSGISIKDVKIEPSPDWLQERLKSIGLKPVNNIVDITNFVLHEMGQPLHAFDADKIKGNKVVVRKAIEGEKFTTLDNVEREMKADDLMICHESAPLGIAGVFGGKESGVTESTRNIFLESAYFNPVSIRKTSKAHNLKTDASFRYERGTDPNITIYALKRAAVMMEEIAGGRISSEIIDIYPEPVEPFVIEFSFQNCDRLTGKMIDRNEIKNILKALEIKIVNESADGLVLEVPPFKVDVTREADVIEEVLRIYGYNNIEIPTQIRASLSISVKPDKDKIKNVASDFLSGSGFNEIMTNSLTKPDYANLSSSLGEEGNVIILNPLSTDLKAMRRSLLFGGLEVIAYNQNRKIQDLKLYEFGRVYNKKAEEKTYGEQEKLVVFVSGRKQAESWNTNDNKVDFYHLKGFVNAILEKLGIEFKAGSEAESDIFSYGFSYTSRKKRLAELGLVNKKVLKAFDISQEVFYAELDWDYIIELQKNKSIRYKEVPKFPEVRRDLALVLDKEIKFSQIAELAYQAERNFLKDVNLFDVYEGDKIEAGKKSYAMSFVLQDPEKTLTDKQIDKIMEKLLQGFQDKTGAKLR